VDSRTPPGGTRGNRIPGIRVHRDVRDRQGEWLWLEQDLEIFGRGRGTLLLVMGAAWMLEFIHMPKGRMTFHQDGRQIHPEGKRFGVFYAPFSITEIGMASARLNWAGVAGHKAPADARGSRRAVLFPVQLGAWPSNAREALDMFRRRRQEVDVAVTLRAPRLATRAKTAIEGRYAAPASVASLAAQLGVSHAHLTRSFKSAYRMTPLQYWHRLRMNDAYHLLSQGERIVDVSLDVGYNDLSRFYKQFRKLTRCSPGDCRL
jgi:AraC-like DNA-binding protein